jgi:hypothetical protein
LQNLASAGRDAPQLGQALPKVAPQLKQNLLPAGFSLPQLWQGIFQVPRSA